MTYFMLFPFSACRTVLSAVYSNVHFPHGARVAGFISGFPSLVLVFLSAPRQPVSAKSSVFQVAVYEACVSPSIETVLCTLYLSMTLECELTTIMQNSLWLRGNSLLYAAVAILPAMLGFVFYKVVLSMKTTLSGQKVGVSETRRS